MQEQRLTSRLQKYWELVRKTSPMPEIEHFNLDPIRDLWPQCFLLSVDCRSGVSYKYEYMGDAISAAYGSDLSGRILDRHAKQFPGAVMMKKLGEVVEAKALAEDNGFFMNEKGRMIKYRACFLPFGGDKRGLTHIAVGLSFRVL